MNELDTSYQSFLRQASKAERDNFDQALEKETRIEKEILEQNIRSDKEHLTIVNFCVNRFSPGAYLNSKTGYVWVRLEPLYSLNVKNFDIAIYNRRSKVMILVECKSGLYDANREIAEIGEKTRVANTNLGILSTMIGDSIRSLECALCVKAGLVPAARSAIISSNLPCCLWSADIFGSSIYLEKLGPDTLTEIAAGRLHTEDDLRRILLGVVKEMSSTRVVTFLPSSHMCGVLEEIIPLLRLEMERTAPDQETFTLNDVKNIVKREISLQNFADSEKHSLAEKTVLSAIGSGIFIDLTPNQAQLQFKKLKLAMGPKSARQLAKDCREKYVAHHARENARRKVLATVTKRQSDLTSYG